MEKIEKVKCKFDNIPSIYKQNYSKTNKSLEQLLNSDLKGI